MLTTQSTESIETLKVELESAGGQSNFYAVANIVLTGVGVGMLSLPGAVSRAGYAFGFALLIYSGIVGTLYTQLLRACMKPNTRNYEHIGRDAFGRWGVVAVAFGVNGGLLGSCCLLVVLLGENSFKLYDGIRLECWVLIWVIVLLPISWLRNMKHVGYISGTVGTASVIILMVTIIYAGFVRAADDDAGIDSVYEPYPKSALGLGISFGSMTLAYTVTCASTTVLHDMKDASAHRRVIYWGVGLLGLVYFLVSLSGYIGWGASLSKFHNIIDVITEGRPTYGPEAYLCISSILVLCLTHYAVLLNPVSRIVEEAFRIDEHQLFKSYLARSTLVAFTAITAIFVPNFEGLVGLLGSVCYSLIHNFYPSIFYIRLVLLGEPRECSRWMMMMKIAGLGLLMIISFIGSVCGVYEAIPILVK
ncbi:Vesicular inhibitory amino acid transporter, putative [Perkinsus marinus ATCC 50983]|uniref:Vesicular inhibitory amino acid transporter, putative n=1 Tax=Perkinsus marinus (strain ATCC 50983 / TXsc) TaxID=423536 RepID=C5L0B0_PERM5|nr:Vesicular inhibitory amino acid transporter, putative [Perkinsus marinus ATCC 50983]EER09968.1 Vesicular inhibitory amino acid transporter, putative [Perkinsus marinus ATCC 50983]|eukprot:XP_002778173.1 Vesicular inhibitory amino acid transporter, putative [Perkinsus marinus ATCC 50983]